MDNQSILDFLLEARSKTYASDNGSVEPLLKGSKQLEYGRHGWLYRDVYNQGRGLFMGIETVYYNHSPLWSMSYFGDFGKMTEAQADRMIRQALIDHRHDTRIFKRVHTRYADFQYLCDGEGTLDELSGTEEIIIRGETVYFFYYAGGRIG
jgi:hypothetical protein